MPARKENSLKSDIKKLAIIAGSGVLPQKLQAVCDAQGIETSIIGIKGSTDQVTPDLWTRIGTSAKTLAWLQQEKINDIVMIGAVNKPNLLNLWPDWPTAKFFFGVWKKSFGDSNLLSAARQTMENYGFKLHGVHKFLPELLMPEGILGSHVPKDGHQMDVQVGLKESQALGRDDIGQAVIVKDGKVIGRENAKGTSALIKRHGVEGAILVKTCKPQQDKDMDLPTIGPNTAALCAVKKMAGIVGHADNTLLADRAQIVQIADKHDLFLMGVTIDGA